jgi:tetratricopeptide (TPR) repeat protein
MQGQSDTELMLLRARLLMEEGQNDLAIATLEEIQTDDQEQQRQVAYLSAWYHTRLGHWSEALRLLSPLYTPGSIEDNWNDANHNERERRAFYLLCLGNAAVNLNRFEEASQHYTQCLKLLGERRVNLPQVRIKAQYSLGMAYIVSGFYALAIQQYEEALQLCKHDSDQDDLPDIYFGLCEANRQLGKFEIAYRYGTQALELYEKRGLRSMEGRIHNVLGRLCYQLREYHEATDHYMESLSIGTLENSQNLKMVNFSALADLRLAEGRLEEAQRYCDRALEASHGLDDDVYLGMMYNVCGKVTLAESEQVAGEQHEILFEEAKKFFEKAIGHLSQTQFSTQLAEVYGRLAQMLEQSGQTQEAITYWKTAYESLSNNQGSGMD